MVGKDIPQQVDESTSKPVASAKLIKDTFGTLGEYIDQTRHIAINVLDKLGLAPASELLPGDNQTTTNEGIKSTDTDEPKDASPDDNSLESMRRAREEEHIAITAKELGLKPGATIDDVLKVMRARDEANMDIARRARQRDQIAITAEEKQIVITAKELGLKPGATIDDVLKVMRARDEANMDIARKARDEASDKLNNSETGK